MSNENSIEYPDLIKHLTVNQIEDIRESVFHLQQTIEQVPKELDNSFASKINRILDITSDIEAASRELRKSHELKNDAYRLTSDQENKIANLIASKVLNSPTQRQSTDYTAIILCSILSASLTAIVFYLLVAT